MLSQNGKKTKKTRTISKPKKVFVGMSGGVDSSVSAALLQKAGYDVTGVFIKVWQPDWIECTWREERRDAMRVAAKLKIPFVTLDLVQEYKKGVIDYMITEYKLGRTPNPDVMCNREVKFGAFSEWAKKNGADYVATGHYAQIRNEADGSCSILAGLDKNKDQSYFLWTLNQNDLKHILFPIGHLEKPTVRKLAEKFGLSTASKKDSQGLCFIGKVDVKDFLSKYIKLKPGNVMNEKGKIIGSHSGSNLLTIGERHGFTITDKTPNDLPYYVLSKNLDENTVTVSNRSNPDSKGTKNSVVNLINCNWTNSRPEINKPYQARERYRQALEAIKIIEISEGGTKNTFKAKIEFQNPQIALTPGQSLVIYDGEVCMGGGIIE